LAAAADEIQASDRRIETVRGSGSPPWLRTPSAASSPAQGAVIDLISGEKAGEMVVASPTGQYIALGRGGFGGGVVADSPPR